MAITSAKCMEEQLNEFFASSLKQKKGATEHCKSFYLTVTDSENGHLTFNISCGAVFVRSNEVLNVLIQRKKEGGEK